MGIELYREIIVGIRLKINELPLPITNDKYVPYINGHKNETLRIIPLYEEGICFIGHIRISLDNTISTLESEGYVDGDISYGFQLTEIYESEYLHLIEEFEQKLNIKCRKNQIAMWLVSYYF